MNDDFDEIMIPRGRDKPGALAEAEPEPTPEGLVLAEVGLVGVPADPCGLVLAE